MEVVILGQIILKLEIDVMFVLNTYMKLNLTFQPQLYAVVNTSVTLVHCTPVLD